MFERINPTVVKETVDRFFLGLESIYCVVNKDQKSVGGYKDFHEAILQAEARAIAHQVDAPYSIEKREKIWFSDRPIRELLAAKRY